MAQHREGGPFDELDHEEDVQSTTNTTINIELLPHTLSADASVVPTSSTLTVASAASDSVRLVNAFERAAARKGLVLDHGRLGRDVQWMTQAYATLVDSVPGTTEAGIDAILEHTPAHEPASKVFDHLRFRWSISAVSLALSLAGFVLAAIFTARKIVRYDFQCEVKQDSHGRCEHQYCAYSPADAGVQDCCSGGAFLWVGYGVIIALSLAYVCVRVWYFHYADRFLESLQQTHARVEYRRAVSAQVEHLFPDVFATVKAIQDRRREIRGRLQWVYNALDKMRDRHVSRPAGSPGKLTNRDFLLLRSSLGTLVAVLESDLITAMRDTHLDQVVTSYARTRPGRVSRYIWLEVGFFLLKFHVLAMVLLFGLANRHDGFCQEVPVYQAFAVASAIVLFCMPLFFRCHYIVLAAIACLYTVGVIITIVGGLLLWVPRVTVLLLLASSVFDVLAAPLWTSTACSSTRASD